MKTTLIEPGDNPELTVERKNATFLVNKMAEFIHDGPEVVRRRHEILEFVESHPELTEQIPLEFLSREERYEVQTRKAVRFTEIATEGIDGSDFFGEGMLYQSLVMGRDLHALELHYVMFIPTLQGQADEEQQDQWLQLAISRSIIGTYAQTELGHGTNLSRLETTATYDTTTEEFVLNSPTITSTKWWPGALGKSANFAIVMAQLWTKGKCYGIHPFIVQLRDLVTHEPLKSIEIGDIGPKLGFNGGDNGYLCFKHHRIPRRNMLMRYAKVLPNGDYIPPRHKKLSYGSMVFVRSVMCRDQAMQLGAAVTIATRYSAIRRQGGENGPNGPELKILDYQTQQYRLFPHLAATICFLFGASEVRDLYIKVNEQLSDGKTELLASLHALSSGMKAIISWEVAKGIEQCRLACGGHGYSQASAFPDIYAYAVAGCTYEGENIVLLLQVARQLMKAVDHVQNGQFQAISQMDTYLGAVEQKYNGMNYVFEDVDSIDAQQIVTYFQRAARQQIFFAHKLLNERLRNDKIGENVERAWNKASVELCRASKLHVLTYLVQCFFTRVQRCQDPIVRPIVLDLAKLFALKKIATSSGAFISFLSPDELYRIRHSVYVLLSRIRPNAIALVDSLDFSDRELRSVLGRRDGNVYSALLKWAQKSQLNKQQVTSTFYKHLRPMMQAGHSKL